LHAVDGLAETPSFVIMIQVSVCKLCAFVYNIRVVLFSYHVVFCSIQASVEWIWSSRAMYLLHRVSSFWFSRTCILPINALTPLTKLSRTTKWQGVLFPCRFAQLPLYGFASVVVDGLPNCHLRLLYNAWLSFRFQVFDRIFCQRNPHETLVSLLWDTAPEITARFSTLSTTSISFHSSLYLCCRTWWGFFFISF
jgi:hypothetical protein